jgi:hypothetical protein
MITKTHENGTGLRTSLGLRERFRHDLQIVFINNVSETFFANDINSVSVSFEDLSNAMHPGDAFRGSVSKPRNATRPAAVIALRRGAVKPLRLRKMFSEPSELGTRVSRSYGVRLKADTTGDDSYYRRRFLQKSSSAISAISAFIVVDPIPA